MPEYRVRVAGPHGLHARPAARFVRAVQESGLPVRVDRADGAGAGPVNAASILGVLSLGVRGGEEIVLTCEEQPAGADGDGDGAEAVLRSLADLVSGNSPEGPARPAP
ncbi:HPr family phosphocarrier protein [Streptomyces sp. UH6]|uniref:HPr family phosphocarrier protein n=1 Tax=Streptomyces sp. UH6 TaxID=2748379 RepID=UPI0015D4E4FE|nr:HPr family phosphocarrier protein [Streptomyces sp. UH6]NYV77219.1 HPr family phosphocarrier protein [Streptomyces sp. UH6]